MYSSSDRTPQTRKRRYDEMVRTDNCYDHIQELHTTMDFVSCVLSNVWKTLRDTDLEPIQWSWKSRNDSFVPIVTDEEPGPSDLSKIVACTCKEMCYKFCSCSKADLTCTSSCKECHGFFCNNLEQIEETWNNDDSNKSGDIRHFLESCS